MLWYLIIFVAGVLAGGLSAHFYFDIERKRLNSNSLTIETIVHEIKTPLTGLSWIFNSLSAVKATEPLAEENVELVKEGVKQVGNAISLANDALSAMNASADHSAYNFKVNNLADVIRQIAEESRLGAKEKQIDIKVDLAPDLPAFAFDLVKITLALRNIVNNAIKYTQNGGNVSVGLYKKSDQAVISVSDTGIGIPSAELEKVSSRFFRASNASNTSGSGLGLYIVKNIVAGHNGKMDIQSSEGNGTKVTVFLPIRNS